MIELGSEVRDKITKFKGIATSRHSYITGCDQYGVTPKKLKDDGTPQDVCQFDEDRLEVIGPGINKKKVQGEKPGGPQPKGRIIK